MGVGNLHFTNARARDRRRWAGAVVWLAALAGCSSSSTSSSASSTVKGSCYEYTSAFNDWGECQCFDSDQSAKLPASQYAKSVSCGTSELPSGSFCCADNDLNGHASTCKCQRPHCVRDAKGICECTTATFGNDPKYVYADAATAMEVDNCDPAPKEHCCAADGGLPCYCGTSILEGYCTMSNTVIKAGYNNATTCEVPAASCSSGSVVVSSCDGVKYRAPGDTSGQITSCTGGVALRGMCKQDSDCCPSLKCLSGNNMGYEQYYGFSAPNACSMAACNSFDVDCKSDADCCGQLSCIGNVCQ
jgi:hypothetical protein